MPLPDDAVPIAPQGPGLPDDAVPISPQAASTGGSDPWAKYVAPPLTRAVNWLFKQPRVNPESPTQEDISVVPGGGPEAEAAASQVAQGIVPQTATQAALLAASLGAGPAVKAAGVTGRFLAPLARTALMAGTGAGTEALTGGSPATGAIEGAAAQGIGEAGGAVAGKLFAPAGRMTGSEAGTAAAAREAGVTLPADALARENPTLASARQLADWSLFSRASAKAAAKTQAQITSVMEKTAATVGGDLPLLEGATAGRFINTAAATMKGGIEAARRELFGIAEQAGAGMALPAERADALFGDTARDFADRLATGGRPVPGPLKAAAGTIASTQVPKGPITRFATGDILPPDILGRLQGLPAAMTAGQPIPLEDLFATKAALREAIPARVLLGKTGSPEDRTLLGIYNGVKAGIDETLAANPPAKLAWDKAMAHFKDTVLPVRDMFDTLAGRADSEALGALLGANKETIETLMSHLSEGNRAQVRGSWFANAMSGATAEPGAKGAGRIDWSGVADAYAKLGAEKRAALFGPLTDSLDSLFGVARAGESYTGRLFSPRQGGRMPGFQMARLTSLIGKAFGTSAGYAMGGPMGGAAAGAVFFGAPVLMGRMITTPTIARWLAGEHALEPAAIEATRALMATLAAQVPNTPWGRHVLESLTAPGR